MIKIKEFENAMKWGYPAFPFFTSVYFLCAEDPKEKYHCKWNYLNKFEDNQLLGYNSRSLLVMGDKIVQELLSGNHEYLDSLKKVMGEIDLALSRCLDARSKNKLEDLEYWWNPGQKAYSNGANLIFGFDNALDEYLENIKKTDPKLFEAVKSNIIEEKESFMTTAQKDLIKLVDDNPDNFDNAYNKFVDKNYWLQNSYLGKFDLKKEWCQKFYDDNKNREIKKQEVVLSIPDKFKLLTETASFGIFFRDERKKMFLTLIGLMDEWLHLICFKNNWKYEELKWLSMGEVQKCINGDTELLDKAKKYSNEQKRIGLMSPIGILDIDDAIFKEVEELNSPERNIIEFKGTTASKGKVRGIVKVVLDVKKDSGKLNDGDILVTSMTRPEFLPLMSKASAFITDEGGLTCHAGIVAREMNKPCIIGTKNATKILKDGDMVEVDADNGIVRIIKN